MLGKKIEPTQPQTYRFEFFSDENLYTVSFTATLPEDTPNKILEVAGKTTFEKSGDAIYAYLQQLEFSDFNLKKTYLNHKEIMEWANNLLHSDSSNTIDSYIGNVDNYYAVADYQKWIQNDYCEGCYLAIKRIISNKTYDRLYCHNLIGQTFIYDESNDENINYFTIRKKEGHSPFQNLYISKGRPVLPTFGCVDMIRTLRNIQHIHNARQTKDIAIR